jgi:hypothetical protein
LRLHSLVMGVSRGNVVPAPTMLAPRWAQPMEKMMKQTETRTTQNGPALITRPIESRPLRDEAIDATANNPADLDRRLDLALEETFPASDPVSIMCC